MTELAKQFIGKECIIYTMNSSASTVSGIITAVSDNGISIKDGDGSIQAVNLDFVTRIREYPKNKKGKKKSVVLD